MGGGIVGLVIDYVFGNVEAVSGHPCYKNDEPGIQRG